MYKAINKEGTHFSVIIEGEEVHMGIYVSDIKEVGITIYADTRILMEILGNSSYTIKTYNKHKYKNFNEFFQVVCKYIENSIKAIHNLQNEKTSIALSILEKI